VAQNARADAGAFVRALDQAGDVGQDEPLADRKVDHAEVRSQRREGIVGDLRQRGAGGGEESRLAGVRQSQPTQRPR
jgi:hypothetical protein